MVNLVQDPNPPAAGAPIETGLDASARMTAPVMLDRQGPFSFVVDTGANVSVISDDLAARLGYQPTGEAQVHGIAGVQLAPITRVGVISTGRVSAQVPRMPIMPRSRLGADGLLGMDILRGRRLIMNFKSRELEIVYSRTRSQSTPVHSVGNKRRVDPVFVVPARIRFGQLIIVDAEIAGVRTVAFLDSGSQNTVGNLALKAAVARRDSNLVANLARVPLISATGQIATGEMASLPPLRLGGLLVGNMTIAFADLHIFSIWQLLDRPALLVGADVMRQFVRIEIDYGTREVSFVPPASSMTLRRALEKGFR